MVEEFIAQIASLNVENLQLRASEQNLARKLQYKKERTRKRVGKVKAAANVPLEDILEYFRILHNKEGPHFEVCSFQEPPGCLELERRFRAREEM